MESILTLQELQALDTSVLIDMLAQYTSNYTHMLNLSERTDSFYFTQETMTRLQFILGERMNSTTTTEIKKPDKG